MICYRLSDSRYASDLSGRGAEISGGRWNSKGTPALYTCQSRALCLLEIIVHLPAIVLPNEYNIITLEIPDEAIKTLKINYLPKDWTTFPHSRITQTFGDKLLASDEFVGYKIPSAIVQEEYSIVVNPLKCRDMRVISNDKFDFDGRLVDN